MPAAEFIVEGLIQVAVGVPQGFYRFLSGDAGLHVQKQVTECTQDELWPCPLQVFREPSSPEQ